MSYSTIENFASGVDRSSERYALEPGALWEGINGHITRGGSFEVRKEFLAKYNLAPGTFGLAADANGLIVFGSDVPHAMDPGMRYVRLTHPDGLTMTALLDWDLYDGMVYAIAQFSDGSVVHFYDGVIAADWINGRVRAGMVNSSGIAAHLAALLQADATYTTTVVGAVITIEHNTVNTAFVLATETVNATGGVADQTATTALVTPASGGVKEKRTVTIGGTFEPGDKFTVIVDAKKFGYKGNPVSIATLVKTHRRKLYAPSGSVLNFSGVELPAGWNSLDDAGAGFINLATHQSGSAQLTGLAVYQKYLAVLARRVIQIWDMRDDDDLNEPVQFLTQIGTRSPKSVLEYGELDVFFLADVGIRSLRARSAVNLAGVQDVGTPIDKLVREWITAQAPGVVEAACSAVEPEDNRFWMAIGTRVFVFSYFPSKKISAWTWYDLDFAPGAFALVGDRIYTRSGDTVYLYGGDDNAAYPGDTVPVVCSHPYLSVKKDGTFKDITGMDIASRGTWSAQCAVDPNDDTGAVVMTVGELNGVTYADEGNAGMGHHTHVAPVLRRVGAGYASVSKITLYYNGGDAKG